MKLLPIAYFLIFCLNINHNNIDKQCEIERTVKELLSNELIIDCDGFEGKTIKSFKLKVPKKPTEQLKGDRIYGKSSNYISTMKKGNSLLLYDIILNDNSKASNIVIKIID